MARVNQQILAERLQLSQTTVSRALANHPAINADTKAMVWDLAAQLGYQMPPARNRNGSPANEPTVIGVLIAIPSGQRGQAETSQQILRGIAERCSTDPITLDVVYHEPAEHDPKSIQRRLRRGHWKGCILVHPLADEVVDLLSRTIPCVSVVENYRRNFIDSVDVDQIEAFNQIVSNLHLEGHRKIGFLSWVYDVETPWVHHRFGAYVEMLFKLGLEFNPDWVFNLRPEEKLTPKEVSNGVLAALREGVTAFVCAADHQAFEMRQLLTKRGIKVPEECTLTGFDGIEQPAGEPALTTVRVPYDEIGRSAFHQLLRRIEFPTARRRHVLVDGVFVPAESPSESVSGDGGHAPKATSTAAPKAAPKRAGKAAV